MEKLEAPGPIEARSLIRRLEAAAARSISIGPGEEALGTWACAECEDTGWVMVPCRGWTWSIELRRRACSECMTRQDGDRHMVATDCLGGSNCVIGIERIAGRWVARVYRPNQRGKRHMDELQLERFKAYLGDVHPVAADRIRVAFDRILTREKGEA